MKKVLLYSFLFISIFLITGCGSKKERDIKNNNEKENEVENKTESENVPKEIKKIETCPDCVFFYSNDVFHPLYFSGDKRQVLTDYTDDYTTLKNEKGEQRIAFLGGVLDSEKKLTKAYVCSIEYGYNFCLEASTNGSTYEANVELLKKIYGEDHCHISKESYEPENYACRVDNSYAISYVTGKVSNSIYEPYQGCYSVETGYVDCH